MNQRFAVVRATGGPLDGGCMVCQVDLDDTHVRYTQEGLRQIHLYRRSAMTFTSDSTELEWTYEGAVSPEDAAPQP